MNNAQTRRSEALGMLIALYLPASSDYDLTYRHGTDFSANRAGIAENIEKIARLGKTERWRKAVVNWAAMITAAKNDHDLRFGLLQGSVYVSHQVV